MSTDSTGPTFRIWATDNHIYGPVNLPTLLDWVQEQRVVADTWIFLERPRTWLLARQVPDLRTCFHSYPPRDSTDAAGPVPVSESGWKLHPTMLRHVKIFSGLDEQQLEAFLQYLEIVYYSRGATVVRMGADWDAMYLVLDGELRARVIVDGKETTLSTMTTGEFFGEISLLDQGPRSADVLANHDSVLLKISAAAFDKMMREVPEVALPFLFALSRSVASRVRNLTRRYRDSIHYLHAAGADS